MTTPDPNILAAKKASYMKRINSRKPQIASKPTLDDLFPAISEFVRTRGWIEIGD